MIDGVRCEFNINYTSPFAKRWDFFIDHQKGSKQCLQNIEERFDSVDGLIMEEELAGEPEQFAKLIGRLFGWES
jgi:hypothetical protein